MNTHFDVIIIGGGASGFFTAINIAEQNNQLSICILEQSKKVLEKVKISGGGRCNVTNVIQEPKELIKNYPRGGKSLLNAFYTFGTEQTVQWFNQHHVALKTEADGRIFPSSNQSQTIINCFLDLCQQHKISIHTEQKLINFHIKEDYIELKTIHQSYICKKVVFACSTSKPILDELIKLKIDCIPTYPSLFSFNTKNLLFKDLSGVSLENCSAEIQTKKIKTQGSILITHTGITGPCILKLSAFGAKEFADCNYNTEICINWIDHNFNTTLETLFQFKTDNSKKKINNSKPFAIPNRFWTNLLLISNIDIEKNWADINKQDLKTIAQNLVEFKLKINGKSTNKDEFVTAGGVNLNAVNLKTMQSKMYENLYFTGEILNIDGITGGFNFQAAWTTAFLAATHIALMKH